MYLYLDHYAYLGSYTVIDRILNLKFIKSTGTDCSHFAFHTYRISHASSLFDFVLLVHFLHLTIVYDFSTLSERSNSQLLGLIH